MLVKTLIRNLFLSKVVHSFSEDYFTEVPNFAKLKLKLFVGNFNLTIFN